MPIILKIIIAIDILYGLSWLAGFKDTLKRVLITTRMT